MVTTRRTTRISRAKANVATISRSATREALNNRDIMACIAEYVRDLRRASWGVVSDLKRLSCVSKGWREATLSPMYRDLHLDRDAIVARFDQVPDDHLRYVRWVVSAPLPCSQGIKRQP
jgi:hypothetical protein